jgi:hypothetical protein
VRSERESNDLRSELNYSPERKIGGRLFPMRWRVFTNPVHLAVRPASRPNTPGASCRLAPNSVHVKGRYHSVMGVGDRDGQGRIVCRFWLRQAAGAVPINSTRTHRWRSCDQFIEKALPLLRSGWQLRQPTRAGITAHCWIGILLRKTTGCRFCSGQSTQEPQGSTRCELQALSFSITSTYFL